MIWVLLGVNGTMEPVPICWLIQKLPASVTGFCSATPRTKRVTPIDSVSFVFQIWPNFASCRPCCRQLAGLKSAEEILDFCARPSKGTNSCRPWWGSVEGSMRAILLSTFVGRKPWNHNFHNSLQNAGPRWKVSERVQLHPNSFCFLQAGTMWSAQLSFSVERDRRKIAAIIHWEDEANMFGA